MSEDAPNPELARLDDTLRRLQSSTRRTLPMFIVGIAATLLAAGVALYYIVTLSADLRDARNALARTETALAQAKANLATANESLRRAQKTVTPGADADSIAAAISDVSRSQSDLTKASKSIQIASTKLEVGTQTNANDKPPPSSGNWFAVVGSYSIDTAGMEEAKAQLAAMNASGLCGEIWQTQISHNLAVVVGSESSRGDAIANVGRARKSGIAKDAFAQANRGWTRHPASRTCP